MTDTGVDVVLAESHLRFRASGHFDEEIDVRMTVAALGTTSMTVQDQITRAADGAILVDAEMRYVWIEIATRAKTAIPEWARRRLTTPSAPASALPA